MQGRLALSRFSQISTPRRRGGLNLPAPQATPKSSTDFVITQSLYRVLALKLKSARLQKHWVKESVDSS